MERGKRNERNEMGKGFSLMVGWRICRQINLPMAESNLLAIKAYLQPSANVVDSRTVDKVIKSLESNSVVNTGGPIINTNEKHHGLTTLVLQQRIAEPSNETFCTSMPPTAKVRVDLGYTCDLSCVSCKGCKRHDSSINFMGPDLFT